MSGIAGLMGSVGFPLGNMYEPSPQERYSVADQLAQGIFQGVQALAGTSQQYPAGLANAFPEPPDPLKGRGAEAAEFIMAYCFGQGVPDGWIEPAYQPLPPSRAQMALYTAKHIVLVSRWRYIFWFFEAIGAYSLIRDLIGVAVH